MVQLTDTHCHIHSADYGLNADAVRQTAAATGVSRLLCVGTDLDDSRLAVEYVADRSDCWASIGLHPHEAKRYADDPAALNQFSALAARPKVVAIGECGLDYHYSHSPKPAQQKILRFQIEMALAGRLPLIFHVREAFADFWSIFDEYKGISGVIHSFSAGPAELSHILKRGLYVGLNGIMTFSKDQNQLMAAKSVPEDRILLETDAPYLTPVPYRGTMCEPKHIEATAGFLAGLRGESLEELAAATTRNARHLFNLPK